MSKIANPLRGPFRGALGVPPRAPASRGEATFAVPGTHTWTVPPGVTSISMVCVGAGGGSISGFTANDDSSGGAGGGLAWKNAVKVSAGSQISIDVGAGGTNESRSSGSTVAGGDSKVTIGIDIVCHASGGLGGDLASATVAGGTDVVGDGGGSGGVGTRILGSAASAASGGAAGGYSGDGGAGVGSTGSTAGNVGSGGAGGSGGVNGTGSADAGGSGGVGLNGEGVSGAAGSSGGGEGGGGSGGQDGINSLPAAYSAGAAGMFGAGGSVAVRAAESYNHDGATGAVRIIFGKGREFPSTDVGQS